MVGGADKSPHDSEFARALSDDEFATMLKEFDSVGEWMSEQVALNRAASTPDVLNQSKVDAAVGGTES
ncbi:hypothetical protein A3SK_0100110 [Pseudomonas amygdali pv. tabaci str. 6605]|nr:hypothetical protein A3SK_0100110 [Pseudomonas amygdali pv. tabaci str. 6605]BCS43001.1 hypothetical protein Pta6605_13320 [Pseudomonas amygdali pv. tabaci]